MNRILKKFITVTIIFILSCVFYSVSASANEISDRIFTEWKTKKNGQFGDMYICPESNLQTDDIINYCMSVADDKKGKLYDDKSMTVLYFPYDMAKFESYNDFYEFYKSDIYYPLFALYPDTSYTVSANSYYASTSNTDYAIIIELCVNGMPHTSDNSLITIAADDAERQKLAKRLYELADEAIAYSDTDKGRLEYIYNYLRKNVRYGTNDDMRGYTPYGAIFDNLAVCQGYSMAIQDVCYILDIPCIMNFSIQDNHGWNSVFVDGKWRFIDATNGYFMTIDEDDISDVLAIHHFDKELISSIQMDVMKFRGLSISEAVTGDIDGDSKVTAADALMVLQYISGQTSISDTSAADINNDGKVDSYDALLILQIVVQM